MWRMISTLNAMTKSQSQALIFAARAVKDADPIPADYTDEGYWP